LASEGREEDAYVTMDPCCPWCNAKFESWAFAKRHVKHCTQAKGRTLTRLRFGKYKGSDISAVPTQYLEFLVSSAEETIAECEAELRRREAVEQAELPWIKRVVEVGYRELAKKCHPDVAGGDRDDMVELNAAVEKLRELVRT
jgi:hypothetical protein